MAAFQNLGNPAVPRKKARARGGQPAVPLKNVGSSKALKRVKKQALAELAKQAESDAEGDGGLLDDATNDAIQDARPYRHPKPTPALLPIAGCTEKVGVHGKLVVTPIGLGQVVRLAAIGRTQATIAFVLGMSTRQFEILLTECEPVTQAFEIGKGQFEDRFTDAMIRMADQGNVAAAIWVEKSRFGRRDNEPLQQGAQHVHIHFPDSVSPEDYMRSLATLHKDSHTRALHAAPPEPLLKTARELVEEMAGAKIIDVPEDPAYQAAVEQQAKEARLAASLPGGQEVWPPREPPRPLHEQPPQPDKPKQGHSRTLER